MKASQAGRLRELERERCSSEESCGELTLDKLILKETLELPLEQEQSFTFQTDNSD